MTRLNQHNQQAIEKLRGHAPKIFNLTFSDDMGYEFSAVCQDGIIYATPGMLLNLDSDDLTEEMLNNPEKLINDIIETGGAEPIPFDDIEEHEIRELLDILESEIS